MKHIWIQILTVMIFFASCGRNKEKEPMIENSQKQDSTQTVSSQYPPIIYNRDSIPVFYMGQDVYNMDGEVPPTFKGGPYQDFGNYVSQMLGETEVKAQPGSRGMVMVKFIVDYTGEVSFARAVLADDPVLEAEAIRIIKSSPNWEPATMNGKNVNVVVTWPLRFSQ
jgi:protein TonB